MVRDLIGLVLLFGFKVCGIVEDEEWDLSFVVGLVLFFNYKSSSLDLLDSDEDSSFLYEEGN